MTQLSKSARRSRRAIGNSCVIPGERVARGPGSKVMRCSPSRANLGPGLRRGDDYYGLLRVIPGERVARGPGSSVVQCARRQLNLGPGLRRDDSGVIPAKAGIQRCRKTLDSRFRGNDAEVGAKAGIQRRCTKKRVAERPAIRHSR